MNIITINNKILIKAHTAFINNNKKSLAFGKQAEKYIFELYLKQFGFISATNEFSAFDFYNEKTQIAIELRCYKQCWGTSLINSTKIEKYKNKKPYTKFYNDAKPIKINKLIIIWGHFNMQHDMFEDIFELKLELYFQSADELIKLIKNKNLKPTCEGLHDSVQYRFNNTDLEKLSFFNFQIELLFS